MTKEQTKEIIKVMQHYVDGGEIEHSYIGKNKWFTTGSPYWDLSKIEYRIKPYKYPLYFKWHSSSLVIKFTGLNEGEIVVPSANSDALGYKGTNFIPHTDKSCWTQIDEPILKKEITVTKAIEELEKLYGCKVQFIN